MTPRELHDMFTDAIGAEPVLPDLVSPAVTAGRRRQRRRRTMTAMGVAAAAAIAIAVPTLATGALDAAPQPPAGSPVVTPTYPAPNPAPTTGAPTPAPSSPSGSPSGTPRPTASPSTSPTATAGDKDEHPALDKLIGAVRRHLAKAAPTAREVDLTTDYQRIPANEGGYETYRVSVLLEDATGRSQVEVVVSGPPAPGSPDYREGPCEPGVGECRRTDYPDGSFAISNRTTYPGGHSKEYVSGRRADDSSIETSAQTWIGVEPTGGATRPTPILTRQQLLDLAADPTIAI